MGWCNVGADDGAKAVADLLMFNSTLVTLDLRGNGLGDAGGSCPLHRHRCAADRCTLIHRKGIPARSLGSWRHPMAPIRI